MNIAIIPVTQPEHLQLAINLAIGIKTNDRQAKTVLLHTIPLPNDSIELFNRFFDYRYGVKTEVQDSQKLMWLKLNAINLIPDNGWKNAILLDIKTMIVPGKKLSDLFEQLHAYDFTCYNNDFYDFKTAKRLRYDYTFNCDANEAKNHFGLQGKFPQTRTSFLYFKNSSKAKGLFNSAINVFNSSFFTTYKTEKSAEACLNIACSFTDIHPHQVTFMPVFWQKLSAHKNEEYIYHQFPLFEVDIKEPQAYRVIDLYNSVTDYYRSINGITDQHHFRGLSPVKEARKVFGFYHICAMNHYKEVVKEQVDLVVKSGLYDKVDAIFCAVVGVKENLPVVKALLKEYPKFKILSHKEDLKLYEFPTLRLLKTKAEQEKPFFGFYIHTKGVTFPKAPHRAGGDHWRGYLNKYNISLWKDNIENLKVGNELSGATWIQEGDFKRHYRGNFFWFNSDYVRKLSEIDTLNTVDRFQAEFWIGEKNPMIASLADLQVDYNNRIPY